MGKQFYKHGRYCKACKLQHFRSVIFKQESPDFNWGLGHKGMVTIELFKHTHVRRRIFCKREFTMSVIDTVSVVNFVIDFDKILRRAAVFVSLVTRRFNVLTHR